MAQQIPLASEARADDESTENDALGLHAISPDLAYQRLGIVNVVFVGPAGSSDWVLIDAGVPGMTGMIINAAEKRFGPKTKPSAIVLTHGHFDHVGSLESLLEQWEVPVFAHQLELPYLNGTSSFPPPDPTVGGGMMAAMAKLYPRGPIDVGRWLQALPADQSVPPLPGWKWIAVPGHTPGQVAFWRATDRSLIAADAFITTAQESAYAVTMQSMEMHGPPMYYTQDWQASRESVRRLAALEPELAVCGHGRPVKGPAFRAALRQLAENFDNVAVPPSGKYVNAPARVDDQTAYPPAQH